MPAWSGLFDGVGGSAHSLQVNTPSSYRRVARALRRRSTTVLREVIDTVVATSSINGGSAVTYAQVDAGTPDPGNPIVNGGQRTISNKQKLAASSTVSAAQAAQVDALVDYKVYPSSWPVDTSGNGGGDKLNSEYALK